MYLIKPTRDTLNGVMEFDHVIQVHPDGTVSDRPDMYAPELFDDVLSDSSWTLLNGYSGQYGYTGPVMHNSEFIGGTLANDILAAPGIYVAIVSCYSESLGDDDETIDGTITEGWAIAFKPSAAA